MLTIGILSSNDDPRIAIVPETIDKYLKLNTTIILEKNAGLQAFMQDSVFGDKVKIGSREEVLQSADLLLSAAPPEVSDLPNIKKGTTIISMFAPYQDPEVVAPYKFSGLHAYSLDMIPRTSLAQSMDVLSSMASLAGYKAVLIAAGLLPRYFPMLMTASGTIKPAKALVLGAGVAGLQAIATAKRLGAVVEVFDTRKAVKEEVESLGAKFVEVEGAKDDKGAGGYAVEQTEEFLTRQRQMVQDKAAKADVVICTAQIRGKKAPILLTADTLTRMRPGSVIVDLASSTGGNCEATKDKETINHHGINIIGSSFLANSVAIDASFLLSNNYLNFLKVLIKDGQIAYDESNEILHAACITK
ncbi:MAG: NAD(P) transhydrogenase subunit alpha [Saprospiraceae bacterium]|nr:NAD(P) transhydrogenase subunit alpha [Saprospiraceae bacterium]